MAASFVKKSDNLFYLRLTGNTSTVNFAAVSEAGNTYSFYIARPGGDGGTITISKPNSDNGIGVCGTSNANPSPGGTVDNTRFPGCFDLVYQSIQRQQCYTDENGVVYCIWIDPYGDTVSRAGYPGEGFTPVPARDEYNNIIYDNVLVAVNLITYTFSGSGLREYQVTGNNQNGTPYNYNASAGGLMCLGGSSLNWGSNLYAYPGSGYVSNPVALGVKEGGVWKNSYNIYTKYNGAWKECLTGWIKVAGVWKKFYQNYGNSSWINMLENTDDAIDFAIQVIEVWAWPISSFDYGGGMGPGPFESNATSDTATAPNSQSITLYIEIYPETGSYADLSLKRVSDGATIWSRLNNTSTYTETITFNVDAGSSYYFSSFVSVPSYGTSSTYVRRSNSSGTLVYKNSVFVYAD
jgi:hypothetical protein